MAGSEQRAEMTGLVPESDELVGTHDAGWVAQPLAEEFSSLEPNRELLEELARETGGEIIEANRLQRFVKSLPDRDLPGCFRAEPIDTGRDWRRHCQGRL